MSQYLIDVNAPETREVIRGCMDIVWTNGGTEEMLSALRALPAVQPEPETLTKLEQVAAMICAGMYSNNETVKQVNGQAKDGDELRDMISVFAIGRARSLLAKCAEEK